MISTAGNDEIDSCKRTHRYGNPVRAGPLGHHRHLGLDAGMDKPARCAISAPSAKGAVVGKESVDRLFDAHLLHLRARGQAHLETRDTRASRLLAGPDRVLDCVRILPVHVRVVIGDLDDFLDV